MKIKEYRDEKLGESIFCAKHPSGLEIRVAPKLEYDSSYALFAVRFGSVDDYIGKEDGTYEKIPEGTAHFLEHKLFESEELDAFELFAKTGAQANAFTSFDYTAYLFKGSENIETSLGYLLDFVQSPYFTAETVQKEQGIIGQEIRMYQDLPDWEILFNLLKCLYKDNPVSIDIAGTQESIAKIDDKLLYSIYDTYYNPSNMILSIAGNVDPDAIFNQVSKAIKRKKKDVPERRFSPGSPKAVSGYIEEKLPVGKKMFMLGFKEDLKNPEVSLQEELASNVMLEALFGKSTPFFKKMLDDGLIEMDFGASLFNGFGYSVAIINGSADDPEKVVSLVKAEIKNAQKNGLDKAAVERAIKKMYGMSIRGFDSVGATANLQVNLYFSGYKPYAELEAIRKLNYKAVSERLSKLTEEGCALSVIIPG